MIWSAKVTIAPHKLVKRAISFFYPNECPDVDNSSRESQPSNNQTSSEDINPNDSGDSLVKQN